MFFSRALKHFLFERSSSDKRIADFDSGRSHGRHGTLGHWHDILSGEEEPVSPFVRELKEEDPFDSRTSFYPVVGPAAGQVLDVRRCSDLPV